MNEQKQISAFARKALAIDMMTAWTPELRAKYKPGQTIDFKHGHGSRSGLIEQIVCLGTETNYRIEGEEKLVKESEVLGLTRFSI